MEELEFNVSIEIISDDISQSYQSTPDPSLNLTFIYDYTVAYAFRFQVVTRDEDGHAISEYGGKLVVQSTTPCSFYRKRWKVDLLSDKSLVFFSIAPSPPSFTIFCDDSGPVIKWHRTTSSVFDTDTFAGSIFCSSDTDHVTLLSVIWA